MIPALLVVILELAQVMRLLLFPAHLPAHLPVCLLVVPVALAVPVVVLHNLALVDRLASADREADLLAVPVDLLAADREAERIR